MSNKETKDFLDKYVMTRILKYIGNTAIRLNFSQLKSWSTTSITATLNQNMFAFKYSIKKTRPYVIDKKSTEFKIPRIKFTW